MSVFLAQVILIARSRDIESWMQLLVFVILAVLYALANIIKTKAKKAEQQGKGQSTTKPARRPFERPRLLQKQLFPRVRQPAGPTPRREYRPQAQPPRRKLARPQPIGQKLAQQVARAIGLEPPQESKFPLPTPQVEPELQELPKFTSKTIEKLEEKDVAIQAETPTAEYLAEILSDYADPNDLRKALLHYEILGRPLSLRGPSERVIGL